MTVEQFGKALVASGLLTADDVKSCWNSAGGTPPKDAESFGALLVARKLLNDFQVKQILAGRAGALVMSEYVILGEIGAGGMGKVYKARHRRMDRIVALKVMSQAAMRDEASVKRFQREVRAAARLDHPNIVAALDAGEVGRTHFLVMQFVDGGDLSDLIKKNGPLPIEKACDYVVQTARGLSFAHGEGVVHRDIKPANLLLDKKGVVRILDMGLARIDDGGEALTATEQVMGTVDFMSPEQAAETRNADARSDIYSLGCTLWYLLTGKKIYEGDTMISRLMKHRDAPLPSLVKARDDATWSLEQALHRMIAKQAADRYQSMDEVVAALAPFASGGSSPSVTLGGPGSGIGSMMPPIVTAQPSYGSMPQSMALPGSPIAVKAPTVATFGNFAVTAAGHRSESDTDPKTSQLTMAATNRGRRPPAGGVVKKSKSPAVLIGAGFVGLAVVAFGVWVVVRDKDNNVVAELKVPAGGTVEIKTPPPTPIAVKPPTPAPSTSFFNAPQPPSLPPPTLVSSPTTSGSPSTSGSPAKFGDWVSLFDGKSLTGWTGDKQAFAVEQLPEGPALVCLGSRALLWTERQFADFEVDCSFRIPPGANNGLGIRYAGTGDASKDGLEIQILDDASMPGVRDDQRCGSLYRYAAAQSGQVKRAPEWNHLQVRAVGDQIWVTLNERIVTAADLAAIRLQQPPTPGLSRKTGHICLFPISGRTEFRNLRVREMGSAPGAVATSSGVPSPATPNTASSPKVFGPWTELYNGRDLSGWKTLVTSGSNYDVHMEESGGWSSSGGQIKCGTTIPGWLMTERDYADFELELEYKYATLENNSGIYVRAKPSGRISRSAMEIQLTAVGDEVGGITPYVRPTNPVQKPPGQWNAMRIRCDGPKVEVDLNGARVLNADLDANADLRTRPRSGPIGIANWNGLAAGMEFRNLRVRELNVPASSLQPAASTNGAATTSPPTASTKPVSFAAWRGLPGYWTVIGNEVVGATSNGPPLTRNTYFIAPQSYRDVELSVRVKLISGNSGIQIRSSYENPATFALRGPQADFGPGFWGSLYGELTDGMIRAADPAIGAQVVKPNEFIDALVRCYGKHVTIRLNGRTTVDGEFPSLPDEGLIGFQLHKGRTEVVFKDLVIRPLKPDGAYADSPSPTGNATPRLVTSVNSPSAEQDPWPSSDGLRLYVARDDKILMFERASVDEPFNAGVFVAPGRMPTLTADELTIFCIAKNIDGVERLVYHGRNSIAEKFGGSYNVTSLNYGPIKSPSVSADGRTIYYQRVDGTESYPAFASRPSRQAAFIAPDSKLNVRMTAAPFGRLTWPWLSADGLTLLCSEESLNKSPGNGRLLRSKRVDSQAPFPEPTPIVVAGRPLYGRSPRIVAATGDLIFSGTPSLGDQSTWTTNDWDVWTVPGFVAPTK